MVLRLLLLVVCTVAALAIFAAKGRFTREYLACYRTLGGVLAESFTHMESRESELA